MNIERAGTQSGIEISREAASIWKRFRGPLNEQVLAEHDLRVGRLAPVLNRAFTTSLAVRAIAEAIGRGSIEEGEDEPRLAPLDVESLLGAIVMLADDLNRDVCQVVDFLDEAGLQA